MEIRQLFPTRCQTWFELCNRLFESVQRLLADMMLDAFGVDRRGLRINANRQQESINDFVTLADFSCQSLAFGRQRNGAIRLSFQQSLVLQAGHDAVHRYMADREFPRQVAGPARPIFGDDTVHRFNIVFRRFVGVIVPRAAKRIACFFR